MTLSSSSLSVVGLALNETSVQNLNQSGLSCSKLMMPLVNVSFKL